MKTQSLVFVYYTSLDSHANSSVHNLLYELAKNLSGFNFLKIIVPVYGEPRDNPFSCTQVSIKFRTLKYFAARLSIKLFNFKFSVSDILIEQYLRTLYGKNIVNPVFVCVREKDVFLVKKYFPESKIVYWIHSLPQDYGVKGDDFIKLMGSADVLLVPTWKIYERLFSRYENSSFHFKTFRIPNLPVLSNQDRVVGQVFDGVSELHYLMLYGSGPHKGSKFIYDIFRFLSDKLVSRPKLTLSIVGSIGKNSETTVEQISENIKIIHYPQLSNIDLQKHMGLCHYVILPSMWFENAPLFLIEAILNGCVPLCNRVGGLEEILPTNYPYFNDHPGDIYGWIELLNKSFELTDNDRNLISTELNCFYYKEYGSQSPITIWLNYILPLLSK